MKQWQLKTQDDDLADRLAKHLDISVMLAKILIGRGIETAADAQSYLHPTYRDLHSPFLLNDMGKAVDRIEVAIQQNQQIWIYGDYDTDGTTSVSLLMCFFRHIGVAAHYYIPNRFDEGYGLNKEAVQTLANKGCQLLITVDCGVTSVAEIAHANTLSIDVIITDHHQPPPDRLPPAHAIINPKMPNSQYPFEGLAGIGLAFKLAQAIFSRTEQQDGSNPDESTRVVSKNDGGNDQMNPFLESQLDLVTLGTVVDMVPLVGENRTLTRVGLPILDRRQRPGIRALCQVANVDPNRGLNGYTLGFQLGPRINAAGRMDTAHKVIQLLTTESDDEAKTVAEDLDRLNTERRQQQDRIEQQAIKQIEEKDLSRMKSLVAGHQDWHPGIIGIVASRIKDKYHRPSFLLAINGEYAHASGRGIDGINIADGLNACADLLVKHGGHKAAAGFTIETEKIPEFEERFNQFADQHLTEDHLQPRLLVDFEVDLDQIELNALKELNALEPTGMKNNRLCLVTRDLKVKNRPRIVGQDRRHLQFSVTDGHRTVQTIAFGMANHCVALQNRNVRLNLAFSPEINRWQDQENPQLQIQDIQIETVGRNVHPRSQSEEQQEVYPPNAQPSMAKLVDRRNVRGGKSGYIAKVLDRSQPTVIYVRDDLAIEKCFQNLQTSSGRQMGRCDSGLTNPQKQILAEMLADGKIDAIVSSETLPHLPRVTHIIFCHPVLELDQFYHRCGLAFADALQSSPSQEQSRINLTVYLHLLYSDQDFTIAEQLLNRQYPDRQLLAQLYRYLQRLVAEFESRPGVDLEYLLKFAQGQGISPVTTTSALAVFEELELINVSSLASTWIELPATSQPKELDQSQLFRQGVRAKQSAQNSFVLLKQNLEQIWNYLSHECQSTNPRN